MGIFMISIKRYNKLKEEYGHVSSWAIWGKPTAGVSSNIPDMSIFEDEDICNKLNDKYVFVGLNGSSTHGNQDCEPWKNFHSSYEHQKDYKLRHALTGSEFWGSYITDIIKVFEGNRDESKEVNSKKFMSKLRKHPEVVNENIEIFKDELNILSDEKPILIAIGNDSFNILKNNLNGYEIHKIKHYSSWGSAEEYKKEVLEILEQIVKE